MSRETMESRSFVLVAWILMLVACAALARGWMDHADDALAKRDACVTRYERHIGELPRIIVGASSIIYNGELVAATHEIDYSKPYIEQLIKKLRRDRDLDCDLTRVCLDNIVVVESLSASDLGLMNHIAQTAWAAGYDIIVAKPRNLESW